MAREGNDAEGTKPVVASSSKTGPLAALTSWSCDDGPKSLGLPHCKAEAWWWFALYRACLVFQSTILRADDSSKH